MKALVWLTIILLSVQSWIVAYKYASRKTLWLEPRDFAIIVAIVTLIVCAGLVTLLDQMGWYFN